MFLITFVAFLVMLCLKVAGIVTFSGWWLLAIWPGIWLAMVAVLLLIALTVAGAAERSIRKSRFR